MNRPLIGAAPLASTGAHAATEAVEPPRLVVVVDIDQMGRGEGGPPQTG